MVWPLAFQISGGATITEVEVDEKLTARRAAQQGFNDCSFPTIAGDAHIERQHMLAPQDQGLLVGMLPPCSVYCGQREPMHVC